MKLQILLNWASLITICILLSLSWAFTVNCPAPYKCIKIKLLTAKYEFLQNSIYVLHYPRKWKFRKQRQNTGHAIYEDIKLHEKNTNMILYISNDHMNGSSLNFENRIKIGKNMYFKENVFDTIEVSGLNQKDQLYWRELILGEIVVGYVNVPLIHKEEMDSVIFSIRRIN